MNKAQIYAQRIALYRKDINQFAIDMFNFKADKWQKRFFKKVAKSPRVAVKSGQGVGKTAATAIVLIWFLVCFPFAKVVATAPTGHQLNDVLWAEVAKWLIKSPFINSIIKWTKTKVYVTGKEEMWFAVARASNRPENMQGFHEVNMLFIVDEASGVADDIIEAIRGTLSGENNKLVMLGNPTQVSGAFYDSFTSDRAQWDTLTVNSEDSPRTNKENIEALKAKYGPDSNVVRVRVYGEFPTQEDDVFISLTDIEQSINTDYNLDDEVINSIDIGVDVARFGDDKTVISYKVNKKVFIYKKYQGYNTVRTKKETLVLVRELMEKYKYKGIINIKVDDGGVGGGVTDMLREETGSNSEFPNISVLGVNFGKKIKHKHYADSTTYMMSIVRDMISRIDHNGNPKEVDLILPDDNDLAGQLSCRKYGFEKGSTKQRVESKDDMKKRGLSSPDTADSVLLACLPVRNKKKKKRRVA